MPPLDHATLQAVLDKQGMPNTTENLNRIAQFAAVAPDMLDKYLGVGTDQARDDSAGGTNAAIDRSIASTADPRLAQLAGPNPYSATIDQNTGMTNIGPGLVREQRGTGGGGGPKKQGIPGDYNAPVGAPPFTTQAPPPASGTTQGYEPSTGAPMPVPSGMETSTQPPNGSNAGQGGSWTNYIIPSILGLFAANAMRRGGGAHVPPGAVTPPISQAIPNPAPAAAAAAATPNVPAGNPALPQPPPSGPAYVPGGVPQPGSSGPGPQPYTGGRPAQGPHNPPPPNDQPPYMPPPNAAGQTPAEIARLKAEVDAENLKAGMKTRARSGGGGGRTTP